MAHTFDPKSIKNPECIKSILNSLHVEDTCGAIFIFGYTDTLTHFDIEAMLILYLIYRHTSVYKFSSRCYRRSATFLAPFDNKSSK